MKEVIVETLVEPLFIKIKKKKKKLSLLLSLWNSEGVYIQLIPSRKGISIY